PLFLFARTNIDVCQRFCYRTVCVEEKVSSEVVAAVAWCPAKQGLPRVDPGSSRSSRLFLHRAWQIAACSAFAGRSETELPARLPSGQASQLYRECDCRGYSV